jgi:hypothetical protein
VGSPAVENESRVAQRTIDAPECTSHGASRMVRAGVHEEPECLTRGIARGDE